MASSAGLFLLVDDDCSEEEMRKIVKKLKRKFNNCHVTSDEAENASSKRQKRSHNTEHSSSEDADIPTSDAAKTTGKCAKNSCESGNDTSCELCVPKKRGKKEKSAKSKKLTSRLKRIMKHKTGNNQMQVDQTDSYDTDSTSSVDSGIHCDGASAGSAAVLARDKSNIVALDCEFVGVGPTRKSALGKFCSPHSVCACVCVCAGNRCACTCTLGLGIALCMCACVENPCWTVGLQIREHIRPDGTNVTGVYSSSVHTCSLSLQVAAVWWTTGGGRCVTSTLGRTSQSRTTARAGADCASATCCAPCPSKLRRTPSDDCCRWGVVLRCCWRCPVLKEIGCYDKLNKVQGGGGGPLDSCPGVYTTKRQIGAQPFFCLGTVEINSCLNCSKKLEIQHGYMATNFKTFRTSRVEVNNILSW